MLCVKTIRGKLIYILLRMNSLALYLGMIVSEISDKSCGTTDNTKEWDYLLRYQLSGSAAIGLHTRRDESHGQAGAKTEDH